MIKQHLAKQIHHEKLYLDNWLIQTHYHSGLSFQENADIVFQMGIKINNIASAGFISFNGARCQVAFFVIKDKTPEEYIWTNKLGISVINRDAF